MADDGSEGLGVPGPTPQGSRQPGFRVRILLVEDDAGDALLVDELLAESDLEVSLVQVDSVAGARTLLGGRGFDCVLLDLALPDSLGLDGLSRLLQADRHLAVVVLTGLTDRNLGMRAVAAGAQDYLVKSEVDSALLDRSIRYAVERSRAEVITRRLFEAELHRTANARIQRGLLPRPLFGPDGLQMATLYRPGGGGDVLGGDFYDAVETTDGTVRVVIGDVSGHGPDEAALGVAMRIAWRTLVLAGTPDARVLPILDGVLVAERQDDDVFVTVCDITVDPGRRTVAVRTAGHPAPILLEPFPAPATVCTGPPLGILPGLSWASSTVALPDPWSLLVFTDGIIEGLAAPGGAERLGVEGLLGRLYEDGPWAGDWDRGLLETLEWVESRHGGSLPDDVALMVFGPRR